MTIDWAAFLLVLVVSMAAAAAVVALFAGGIRLWSTPAATETGSGVARDDETDDPPRARPVGATAGSLVLFVLAGAVVVSGVVLLVT